MPAPFVTVHDATNHVHLILGTDAVARARCRRSLDVGALPTVIAPLELCVHVDLQNWIAAGRVLRLEKPYEDADLTTRGRFETDGIVDAVFITTGGTSTQNAAIAARCRRLRIPINVTDAPSLCTFTLPALHADGPLQIGITTSGMGCKLAGRVRRHIYASLPPDLGRGVQRLGAMRRRIIEEDAQAYGDSAEANEPSDDEALAQEVTFNQRSRPAEAAKTRRLRWFAHICEHWPLHRLASISDADIDALLAEYATAAAAAPSRPSTGRIILAGAGPGSPHLLTLATHRAIQAASLVLADKLVPAEVLALVPRRTPVHIAEKFPGNADAAQDQLLTVGLQALRRGHTVLRLKQGDPYIYGRGGEELHFFRAHGFPPIVLPGVTAALAAPLAAAIPLTHRGVADDVRICTGVGRKGTVPVPPAYVPSQTVVILMVLNRLPMFVASLVGRDGLRETAASDGENGSTLVSGLDAMDFASPLWPLDTPCAIVERASCRDQRVVRTTLQYAVRAWAAAGSRPPGLLVLGRACAVLQRETSKELRGNFHTTSKQADVIRDNRIAGTVDGVHADDRETDQFSSNQREMSSGLVSVTQGDGYVIEEGCGDVDTLMAELDLGTHRFDVRTVEGDGQSSRPVDNT